MLHIALVAGAVALWGLATPLLAQDNDDLELLHYWSFNDPLEEGNPWPEPVNADLGSGVLTYTFDPGSLGDFAGTTVNVRLDEPAGESFSVAGSSQNGMHFELGVPTSGFENMLLSYAQRGTGTGFSTHEIQYSTDGGASFAAIETFTGRNNTGSSFDLLEVDFSSLDMVNDNPDFVIRITVDGASSGSGNNRFDNITIEGVAIEDVVEEGPIANITQGTFHETLTDAISSAQASDSLTVSSGTYEESVTIDKPLILQGIEELPLASSTYTLTSSASGAPEGAPIIEGLVTLEADNITLRGLTVDGGSGSAVLTQPANVGYDGVTLEENTFMADSGAPLVYIHGGFDGVTLSDPSTNVAVTDNAFGGSLGPGVALGLEATSGTVTGNTFAAATSFGHLELWGFEITVADNTFDGEGLDDGFYIRDSTPGGLYDMAALKDGNTFDPEAEILDTDIRPAGEFVCPMPSFTEDDSAIFSDGIALLTIEGSDGAGITDVNFVDPDEGDPALVNLIATTDTPDFTSEDGISFSFDGPNEEAPMTVEFTLTVDEPEGLAPGETFTASYFAKVINACENTLDVDPVQTLNASPSPIVQLKGNYPNPFAEATTLQFALPEAAQVRLSIVDLLGREVAVVVDERVGAGMHEVVWDGRVHGAEAAAGVYFARLQAAGVDSTHRLVRAR